MQNWASQWSYSVENVSDFVDNQEGVLFLGRSFEGSFWVRGVELSAGVQLYCGLRSEYKTLSDFAENRISGHYSFIIFTKFFEYRFSLVKARRVASYLLYDTVDNFHAVPLASDAVLVNTRAQKSFYEYMNLTMPVFVLPHHVGNHNGFSVRGPRPHRGRVLVDPRVPREAVKDLDRRAAKRRTELDYGSSEYDSTLPLVPNSTYARSLHYSLQTATFDVVFRWVGYRHVGYCFKPGHRLANSLSVGVPTVSDESEGFLEILDDAGVLDTYPFLVEEHAEGSRLTDKLLTSDSTWREIGETAGAVNAEFSLRTISWRLFDILFALSEGRGLELSAELSKPVILDYCSPERLLEHYESLNMNFWVYDEFENKTKTKTILVQGRHRNDSAEGVLTPKG